MRRVTEASPEQAGGLWLIPPILAVLSALVISISMSSGGALVGGRVNGLHVREGTPLMLEVNTGAGPGKIVASTQEGLAVEVGTLVLARGPSVQLGEWSVIDANRIIALGSMPAIDLPIAAIPAFVTDLAERHTGAALVVGGLLLFATGLLTRLGGAGVIALLSALAATAGASVAALEGWIEVPPRTVHALFLLSFSLGAVVGFRDSPLAFGARRVAALAISVAFIDEIAMVMEWPPLWASVALVGVLVTPLTAGALFGAYLMSLGLEAHVWAARALAAFSLLWVHLAAGGRFWFANRPPRSAVPLPSPGSLGAPQPA